MESVHANTPPVTLKEFPGDLVGPYGDDPVASPDESRGPHFWLDGVARTGLSPTGTAFAMAWYGDSARLFELLSALENGHMDTRNLRWGRECMAFTTDEAAHDFALLHVAVLRGHFKLVRELVEYGIAVDDQGAEGGSPSPLEVLLDRDGLSFETRWPDRKTYNTMVALLLDLGAKPNSSQFLLRPIVAEDRDLLEMLLQAGADPSAPMGVSLNTPILSAHHCPELVRVLLRYGADATATNALGVTVFDFVPFVPGLGDALKDVRGR